MFVGVVLIQIAPLFCQIVLSPLCVVGKQIDLSASLIRLYVCRGPLTVAWHLTSLYTIDFSIHYIIGWKLRNNIKVLLPIRHTDILHEIEKRYYQTSLILLCESPF